MPSTVEHILSALILSLIVGSVAVWITVAARVALGRTLVPFEPRPAVPWTGWDVVLLAFLALLCEGSAMRWVPRDADAPLTFSLGLLSASGLARVAWVVLAAVYLLLRRGACFDDLGFDPRRLRDDIRIGWWTFVAALIPVYGLQLLFTEVLEMPSEHPLAKMVREQASYATLSIVSVMVVIVAPLAEEFFFRVVLQGWLEKRVQQRQQLQVPNEPSTPGWTPIVLVSLLFGAMHYGHGPDPIALFVLSLFLGYLYRQTHRIFASLTLHACVNGLSALQLWTLYFTQ